MKFCAFNNPNIPKKSKVVDGTKIVIKDEGEVGRIWNDPRLIWYSNAETLNKKDWETIWYKEKKIFNGIIFGKTQYGLHLIFSPHKYRNNNLTNADDFRAIDCIKTIKTIIELLKIDQVEKYQIKNLEIGLNFIMPGYGKDLVMFTEYWKKTLFKYDRTLAFSKKAVNQRNGRDCTYKRFKLYCKYTQEPDYCEPDTQRLEIASGQTRYIKGKLGIENIGCLLNPMVYETIKNELIQAVKDVLILDHKTSFENLNKKEKLKLKEYLTNHTWYLQTQKYANGFWQMKQRYFQLLDKTGRNVHTELLNIVETKLNDLTRHTRLNSKTKKVALILPPTRLNSTVDKGGISTYEDLSKFRCKVFDLTLENESPIKKGEMVPNYIRTKTLRYLLKNDRELFEKLRIDLIPNKKHSRPKFESTLISHMAKQIRNRYHNAIRLKKKGYNEPKLQYDKQLNLYQELGLELIC